MKLRKRIIGALAIVTAISLNCHAATKEMPTGNPLVFGNNRITLITPTLFRLESTTDGKFIDQRTMFAYDRTSLLADSLYSVELIDFAAADKTQPDLKVHYKGKKHPVYRITTPALKIEYVDDGQPFSTSNLTAFYTLHGKDKVFTIRQIAKGNLGGPIETLDRVSGEVPLGDGLLSTSGWYVIDDNRADFLDKDGWITPRP